MLLSENRAPTATFLMVAMLASALSTVLLASACSVDEEPPSAPQWRALVEATAWERTRMQSPFIDPAGKVAPCDAQLGAVAEVLNLEMVFSVMTQFCPYVTVQQPSLQPVERGDTIRLRFWHSELTAPSDSVANVLVVVGDELLWSAQFAIPMDSEYIDQQLAAPAAFAEGTPIWFHVDNHGANEYSLIELSVR